MGWLDDSIIKQRSFIEGLLHDPLSQLADICTANWNDRDALDQEKFFLQQKTDHRCRLLYAIDDRGLQHSSNVSDEIIDKTIIGQNLSVIPIWIILTWGKIQYCCLVMFISINRHASHV